MVEDQSWVFRSVSARNVLKYIYLVGPTGGSGDCFPILSYVLPHTYVYKRWVLSLLKTGPRLGSVDHICDVERPGWALGANRK